MPAGFPQVGVRSLQRSYPVLCASLLTVYFGVDAVGRALASEACQKVLGRGQGHGVTRVERSRGNVRGQHYVFERKQAGVYLGFVFVHVEACAGYLP